MAEREEKYIVVKLKDLKVLRDKAFDESLHQVKKDGLLRQISGFDHTIEMLDNQNEYLVINLDEPYAFPMWDILIAFETLKEKLPKEAPAQPDAEPVNENGG